MRYISIFLFESATSFSTLSLHDALPISHLIARTFDERTFGEEDVMHDIERAEIVADIRSLNVVHDVFLDRKSTRLNSSHRCISYAVFCLKKKKLLEIYHNLSLRL